MSAQLFTAVISEHTLLASKFHLIRLELSSPSRLEFLAGQYILLRIPGSPKLRQYSITSSPSVDHAIDLLVDVSPMGEASRFLLATKPGERLEFLAPAGKFTVSLPEEKLSEKVLWFVATGSGIAPMRSMIVDLLVDKKERREIWLHWGLRFKEDIFWFEDFAELAEEYDNFHFDLVLSRPPGEWQLCHGHTTDCVRYHHEEKKLKDVGAYLCGNKVMIEEVSRLLGEKGMPAAQIHSEQFYDVVGMTDPRP